MHNYFDENAGSRGFLTYIMARSTTHPPPPQVKGFSPVTKNHFWSENEYGKYKNFLRAKNFPQTTAYLCLR